MRAKPARAIGGIIMKNQQENEDILVGESLPENKEKDNGINYMNLKEGMNIIESECNAGTLHIWVKKGCLAKIDLFNGGISKKKTHNDNGSRHVNLDVDLDWNHVFEYDEDGLPVNADKYGVDA
jgi:hypothetical protein